MSETNNPYVEETSPSNQEREKPNFEIRASRQFVNWMAEQDLSLGFSTYQSGKVFLIGYNVQSQLSLFERSFPRPMGLWTNGQTMLMSSLYQIYRLQNTLPAGQLRMVTIDCTFQR